MKRSSLICGSLTAVLLIATGCGVRLVEFRAPEYVYAGESFEVVVIAETANTADGANAAAAVIQVPNGFTVTGVWAYELSGRQSFPIAQGNAAVAALFAAEPQHTLLVFEGAGRSSQFALRVRLSAPYATGLYNLKVALADQDQTGGIWRISSNADGDFAALNTSDQVRRVTVVTEPLDGTPSWSDVSSGLPTYDGQTWSGVAAGDFDGNGLDEIVAIAAGTYGPKAFLNFGASWTDVSNGLDVGVISGEAFLATGDLNGDGFLDLADGNGRVYFAYGDLFGGGFVEAAGTPLPGGGFRGVAVADIDGDGIDDVVFGGNQIDCIKAFLATGSNFASASAGLPSGAPSPSPGGHEIHLQDLDLDGFLDIFWLRRAGPGIWLGDGGTSWTAAPWTGSTASAYSAAAFGDVDDDGTLDIVLVGSSSNPSAGIRLQRQTGVTPGAPVWVEDLASGLPTTGFYRSVVLRDFDGDGHLDVLATLQNEAFVGGGVAGGIEMWRGDQNGTFSAASDRHVAGLPQPWLVHGADLVLGDFDGDGLEDVAAAWQGMGLGAYLRKNPVLPEMAGSVGEPIGAPMDTLFVNGSAGGLFRRVDLDVNEYFSLSMDTPVTSPTPVNFVLYGILGAATSQTGFDFIFGRMAMLPHALAPNHPALFTIVNGFDSTDPRALLLSSPTPWFAQAVFGLPFPFSATIQGVIQDPSHPGFAFAATNAIRFVVD